jgi:hypothetical protein
MYLANIGYDHDKDLKTEFGDSNTEPTFCRSSTTKHWTIIYKISYKALLKHKEFETIKTRHDNDLLGFHLEHAQLVHTYIPAQTFGFITHHIEIARIETLNL